MRARETGWSTKLRTLGGGATLWLAALSPGCGGTPPVVTPPVELPPVARNVLNADDLAPPTVREGGPLSPARPVPRTAMRRGLVSAVFSPDSKRLFAISTHGELVVYDVETGALRGYARPWYDGTYPQLQVDRSGSRVLTITQDRAPVLWDLHSDTLRTLPNIQDWPGYLVPSLHPDGDRVVRALASAEGTTVVVTRVEDDSEVRAIIPSDMEQAEAPVPSYSATGARIALVTDYGTTFTYLDANDLEVVRTESLLREGQDPTGDTDSQGYRVAFRPQGGQLALGRPGRVELLDSLTARVRAEAPLSGSRVRLEYSADGRWVVAASTTEVVVLEAETGRVTGRVLLADENLTEDDYVTLSEAVPGEGGFLLYTQNGDSLSYSVTGEARELADAVPSDGALVVHSPNGLFRFHGGETPTVTRVDQNAPQLEFVQEGNQVSVWGADFSVDGRTLFTRSRAGVARFGADGLRMLSCGSESPTQRTVEGEIVQLGSYGGCLFDRDVTVAPGALATPDGRVTVTQSEADVTVTREGGRPVRITRSRTSRVVCSASNNCLSIAKLSADGSALGFMDATREGSTRTTWWEIYDTRTGRVRAQGTLPEGYHALRMLPGGAFAVTGESVFTLYDARGRQRLEIQSPSSWGTSNDDRVLVVQSSDRVVHVIDAVALRERETWTASDELSYIRVTPDGLRIVARMQATAVITSLDGSAQQRVPAGNYDLATNFAGTFVLTCEAERAVRVDVRSGERTDVAPCEGRPDAISEDGGLAIMTVGSSTRVHRLSDGRVLTLETLVEPAPALLVAHDDTGRWDVSPLDAERVRVRAAGPGETAPLESPDAASRTEGLVGLFLSGQ